MYTFRHENADFAKLFTCNRPYAAASMKGLGAFSDGGGRVLFFPAGERGILAVAALKGFLCDGDCAPVCLSDSPGAEAAFRLFLAPTQQGKIWCAALLDPFGLAALVGRELLLTQYPAGGAPVALARGTVQKTFGQL